MEDVLDVIKDKLILLEILSRMNHVALELASIAKAVQPIDEPTYRNFATWSDQVKDWKERIKQKL